MKTAPPSGALAAVTRAVVRVDDRADDREAEARAGAAALAAALGAPEALEQRARVAGGRPGPWSRTTSSTRVVAVAHA